MAVKTRMFLLFFSTIDRRFLTVSDTLYLTRFIFIKILDISSKLYEIVRKETVRVARRNVDALQLVSSVHKL